MMMYNADFLIAAVVILLLVLRNFLDQKRAEDLNSRAFLCSYWDPGCDR